MNIVKLQDIKLTHRNPLHFSTDGHLGCSHVLAIINRAAMNIVVHVSLSDLVKDPNFKANFIDIFYNSCDFVLFL